MLTPVFLVELSLNSLLLAELSLSRISESQNVTGINAFRVAVKMLSQLTFIVLFHVKFAV